MLHTMERGTPTTEYNHKKHLHRYSREAAAKGPHSRAHSLARIDGRTREALMMGRFRSALSSDLGHPPSVVERALIERCCWLQLRLWMLDKKIAKGRAFTEIDSNTYLAWNNSLVRTLAKLGVEPGKSRNGNGSTNTSSLTNVMGEIGLDE